MQKRFPVFHQILPVLAVIAVMYYTWSVIIFSYKLPGWLYYLYFGEIAGILAYALLTNFLESIVFLMLLLVICAILPPRFLRDEFIVRGSVISIISIGSMMLFLIYFAKSPEIRTYLFIWIAVALVLAIAVSTISTRIRVIRQSIIWISDRLIVFLYFLLPFSAFSLFYLVLRAIFI